MVELRPNECWQVTIGVDRAIGGKILEHFGFLSSPLTITITIHPSMSKWVHWELFVLVHIYVCDNENIMTDRDLNLIFLLSLAWHMLIYWQARDQSRPQIKPIESCLTSVKEKEGREHYTINDCHLFSPFLFISFCVRKERRGSF